MSMIVQLVVGASSQVVLSPLSYRDSPPAVRVNHFSICTWALAILAGWVELSDHGEYQSPPRPGPARPALLHWQSERDEGISRSRERRVRRPAWND